MSSSAVALDRCQTHSDWSAWLRAHQADPAARAQVRKALLAGADPVGEAYCRVRRPDARREAGQTFTPSAAAAALVDWAAREGVAFEAIVDPGAGTGRLALAALLRWPRARGWLIEPDPELAWVAQWHLGVLGLSDRAQVVQADFFAWQRPSTLPGPALWIANPPYVRHHALSPAQKQRYQQAMAQWGIAASQLAGLHAHFLAHASHLVRPGDRLAWLTSAEWLDTAYGQALRQLTVGPLGLRALSQAASEWRVFPDALVSAVFLGLAPAAGQDTVALGVARGPEDVLAPSKLHAAARLTLATAKRWSPHLAPTPNNEAQTVALGDWFRVSRGIATGKNAAFVISPATPDLPARYTVPVIAKAQDISRNPGCVSASSLKRLVVLPARLEQVSKADSPDVERFLTWARALGADQTHLGRHRSAWWSLPLRPAPPIVMTYMGRQPPVFALNPDGAQLLNIAHGLYPRRPLAPGTLARIVAWLNAHVSLADGRAYGGGLVKFEPSEVMALRVPAELFAGQPEAEPSSSC